MGCELPASLGREHPMFRRHDFSAGDRVAVIAWLLRGHRGTLIRPTRLWWNGRRAWIVELDGAKPLGGKRQPIAESGSCRWSRFERTERARRRPALLPESSGSAPHGHSALTTRRSRLAGVGGHPRSRTRTVRPEIGGPRRPATTRCAVRDRPRGGQLTGRPGGT